MFKFEDLEQIQIEITSNCQASCPMCSRNYHGGLPNPLLSVKSWSLQDFKDVFTDEVILQIKTLNIVGAFGEPILNNNLLDMCKYLKEKNFLGTVNIHTNGSARDVLWWKRLATDLTKNHLVTFALDGREDTHSLYRIGTNYETILRNAKAFIDSGGLAEWAFIKFEHNQHQVKQAEEVANLYGFHKFSVKHSKRFIKPTFDVLDKQGKKIYELKPASDSTVTFFDKKILNNYKEIISETKLKCQSKNKKELYIDAAKNLFPCCYIASESYQYSKINDDLYFFKKQSQLEVEKMVSDLGGLITVDINNSIKKILNSESWQTVWEKHLQNKPLVCVSNCGIHPIITTIEDQYVKRLNLSENHE